MLSLLSPRTTPPSKMWVIVRRSAEGYVGLDVHHAARIVSAGHGGQVLLSQTTRDLVQRDLPDGVSLQDLGAHRRTCSTPVTSFSWSWPACLQLFLLLRRSTPLTTTCPSSRPRSSDASRRSR